jgi:hypothetical protein
MWAGQLTKHQLTRLGLETAVPQSLSLIPWPAARAQAAVELVIHSCSSAMTAWGARPAAPQHPSIISRPWALNLTHNNSNLHSLYRCNPSNNNNNTRLWLCPPGPQLGRKVSSRCPSSKARMMLSWSWHQHQQRHQQPGVSRCCSSLVMPCLVGAVLLQYTWCAAA